MVKMLLRCFVYPTKSGFFAENLELGLAAEGTSIQEAVNRLNGAIKAYISLERECLLKGEKVKHRHVSFYWPKRIIFQIFYLALQVIEWYRKRSRKKGGKSLRPPGIPRPFLAEKALL